MISVYKQSGSTETAVGIRLWVRWIILKLDEYLGGEHILHSIRVSRLMISVY
jgi:hypothetical protein